MKKKKEPVENAGPLNWEEVPAGDEVDWNAFGRVDLMFPDNGDRIEEQLAEEAAAAPAAGIVESVRPEVLRHTALAVMSECGVSFWTEEKALKRMSKLIAGVTAAVKAVTDKPFTEAEVQKAITQAVAEKNGAEDFADTVRNKWTGNGIALADSVAYVLDYFRKRLPDMYQDNPVIGWSIRNDGCTFIFRDGQKKVIEL